MINRDLYVQFHKILQAHNLEQCVFFIENIEVEFGMDKAISFLIQSSQMENSALLCYVVSSSIANKSWQYHRACREILSGPLCYIEGAEQSAVFHAKTLCTLFPENKENWKSYYNLLSKFENASDIELARIKANLST